MDLRFAISLLLQLQLLVVAVVAHGRVFHVHHKYAGKEPSLNTLKAHDSLRHRRILANVDLPLGGSGSPVGPGLYFTKIGIGTPSKDYYVQVDTGSDISWVNCIQCTQCPRRSGLGIELKLYDQKASTTSKLVFCDDDFCLFQPEPPYGCAPDMLCEYNALYGDGSSSGGYYVKDFVKFDRVNGNFSSASANTSVVFGCGATQSGGLASEKEALDGLLGFGQSNVSVISQLASSGKVKKVFSHCLDGKNGGGIFAIGQVVQPKVNTTPLVPNQPHYNVNLKGIQVGKAFLQLPTNVSGTGESNATIIDTGTTLAYLPDAVYEPLMKKIISNLSDAKLHTDGTFQCFTYSKSMVDGFPNVTLPNVTFHFENSLQLVVHPREYVFAHDGKWCIGWQNSGTQSKDQKDTTLLGDLVLSNKLVVYDLEKQVVGWTAYNCSSSIKLQDEQSGMVHLVGAHNLSSAGKIGGMGRLIIVSLLISILLSLTY